MNDYPHKTYPRFYKALDRFSREEYRIDQRTYHHIMDLIHFYHDSIYWLPDEELIKTQRVVDERHTTPCEVPVNHLVFEN